MYTLYSKGSVVLGENEKLYRQNQRLFNGKDDF